MAIQNASRSNYEQAIPVLKKYAEMKGLDDYVTFTINVYLNLCYLAIKKELLDVVKVNKLADDYITNHGISITDSIKRKDEMTLLYASGIINTNVGNNEKTVFYLAFIKNIYEENQLNWDQFYSDILILLAQGYFNLSDYKSVIVIGQCALNVNIKLFGEKNITSLEILDLLYLTNKKINELKKSLEYLQKEVEIGKEVLGGRHPDYLESLNNLASAYLDLGEINKAIEINQKVVNLRKEVLSDHHPDYLSSLHNLAYGYYCLGDYKKALEINEQVVILRKEVLGGKHPSYLSSLNNLAQSYSELGDNKKALEINQKVVELRKEVLGDKHPAYLSSLNNLAQDYAELGDYKKAIEINQKVVELKKEVLGDHHPDYLISLNNLAQTFSHLGEYKKALEISQKVVELQKEVLGDRHPDYLVSLNNLASTYFDLGKISQSLEINQKVVELRKEVLGDKHPAYLSSLNNLAQDYAELGNYKKAIEINQKVVELRKIVLGGLHPDYLSSLNNLAQDFLDLGDCKKALEISQKVVALRKIVLGGLHPDYLASLNNLAQVYSELGDYKNALEINQKVVVLAKETLGDRHPLYLTALSNLAVIFSNQGEHFKALQVDKNVVDLRKKVLGDHSPEYLTSLNNLAQDFSSLGDYTKALEIDLVVLDLRKEISGDHHPYFLFCLNNLAQDYYNLKNYNKALEINQIVVDLRKEVLGDDNPEYLKSLSNLACVFSILGDHEKALEIDENVVETTKKILGDQNPRYLTSLNNLALDFLNLGDYIKALETNQNVVVLTRKVLGDLHPDYLCSLTNLAQIEFLLNQVDSSMIHYGESLMKNRERVIDYFSNMSENQRSIFWINYSYYFHFLPILTEKAKSIHPEVIGDGYDVSLFTKGILLNTTRDFDDLIAEKGTPEAIAKFEELKLLKLQIQRLLEKPIAERYMNVDSLRDIAQKKETELVKISKEYGDYTSNLKITWKDVQSKLGDKDVAIEFAEYPTLTDTVKYAAFVLRKGWQYPRMISLFTKDQIAAFIKQDKDKIYSNGYVGKQIKKLVWGPLEEVIKEGDNVYFAASGIIHQLAIENLPGNDSQSLSELYHMYRLSSTKELVIKPPQVKNNTAVLYGGLQYDLTEDKMVAESKKYQQKVSLYAMRGYQTDTTLRKGWGYLEGTLTEVQQINGLMKDKRYNVSFYTGETGNEESFKSLSGKKEGIIHIATHGFFLPIEETRKNLFMQQRMGDQQERGGVDPMLRSGLMLSGGNRAWQGDTIPQGIEDGVITAREISRVDLRGTDMVVLSACETGLGEVSSEGVFGLQRSFKQAGVQTLVMSLWEVSDKATNYMMTQFYTNLLSGKEKREAFLEAKKSCRDKFPEPQYWAAFIMLD